MSAGMPPRRLEAGVARPFFGRDTPGEDVASGRQPRTTGKTVRRLVSLGVVLALVATGCADKKSEPDGTTLRVLAGSELADLGPVLDDVRKATGITVKLSYVGTLDGVERVAAGKADADAVWFGSNRYLELHDGARTRIGTATKVMTSPVVLGVRRSVAQSLGWGENRPTWAEIAKAATDGRFSYGMTNPAASNSGFAALVGVASALGGAGTGLTAAQVTEIAPKLRPFFAGQALTAGSSGWLADVYARRAGTSEPVDGLVNYESVLLSLNASGKLPEPLTIVYPADGVVTADYPLTLLAGASDTTRASYQAVVDHLRRADTQRALMSRTYRRPGVADVPLDAAFGNRTLVELPFPGRLDAVDALISAYFDTIRRPARTIYVLDVSGSMAGDRLESLKSTLLGLTGVDTSLAGRYNRFHGREEVVLIPFSSGPKAPLRYTVPEKDPQSVLDQIKATTKGLSAGGDTAIYDSLVRAYEVARDAPDDGRYTSIVLMTDGELTRGRKYADFRGHYQGLPAKLRTVPVFTIVFGEANADELTELAALTGGKNFDARGGSLAAAFNEIRGYQ